MFTVRRTNSALAQLADLWTNADAMLRKAITAAANEIDQRLQHGPNAEGESRDHGQRVFFPGPLGAEFEVSGSVVRVMRIWLLRRRK